ncbi:hypothetical protein OZ664_19965 [Elizabethkingia sp. HX WHF]|uniref:hypothetical protein n=1 Tax=Elizabethkingia TaxID=308865 RepID=UPI00099A2440|nr:MULTISPECIES: hypothetical protein [Elizabethkingia]MDV2458026.1 hypothetical protein [Elizabethkingia anophelis]MDX8566295.1 hypothetical protein [Elizabethkingia sp. HX WHF]OPB87830.1 hypothetical protein BB020_04410 [Elizabethkingia occulta]BBQ08179.1 hypothetical protein JUNP353_2750 [Elizabethkingia anophelis]
MAYNKTNYYKRIVKVQEIVKREKFCNGLTYKEIYYKFIEKEFNICYRTFSTWLGIPADRELKKLQKIDEKNGEQLTLNF